MMGNLQNFMFNFATSFYLVNSNLVELHFSFYTSSLGSKQKAALRLSRIIYILKCILFKKLSGEGTSNYRNPQNLPKSPYIYRNPPRNYRKPHQIFWNPPQMERYNIVWVFYDAFIQISLCMCTVGTIYQQANK